jgi:hypothetical protein
MPVVVGLAAAARPERWRKVRSTLCDLRGDAAGPAIRAAAADLSDPEFLAPPRRARQIVERVENGELFPNVDYNKNLIALPRRSANVLRRRRTSSIDDADEGAYVLFLTSPRLKHYFTGFLRVPPNGDPKTFFEFADQAAVAARALRQGMVVRGELGWFSHQLHAQMPTDRLTPPSPAYPAYFAWTESFSGSSNRSSCARLVFMREAEFGLRNLLALGNQFR